jgi:PPIC-type PPIASE domain
MRPLPSILLVLALTGGAAFLTLRPNSRNHGREVAQGPRSVGVLAKVGDTELRNEDLRETLQIQSQDHASPTAVKPEDLTLRETAALEHVIEDELLAQAAKVHGLSTALKGAQARQDLAARYVEERVTQLPPLSESELREFYRNHGEKFYVPPAVQVRQLFLALPLRQAKNKKEAEDLARKLGVELAARIRQGESLEKLSHQYSPADFMDRAQVQTFRGGVMEAADEQKVLALQPGEVVGPLRVEGGYSIFQGVARIRGRLIPFFQARANIRAYLEQRRTEDTRKKLVSQLEQEVLVQRFVAGKSGDRSF